MIWPTLCSTIGHKILFFYQQSTITWQRCLVYSFYFFANNVYFIRIHSCSALSLSLSLSLSFYIYIYILVAGVKLYGEIRFLPLVFLWVCSFFWATAYGTLWFAGVSPLSWYRGVQGLGISSLMTLLVLGNFCLFWSPSSYVTYSQKFFGSNRVDLNSKPKLLPKRCPSPSLGSWVNDFLGDTLQ